MQNCFRLLFIVCCTALLFSSCTKDYSNETGSTQIAAGTLKDSTGNCLPDSVAGTFYDGITLGGDTAFVEIQVDVAKTGSYSITTDFQNGFEFADSGFFTSTGLNIIRLKPIGTPILPKSTLFTIGFDSSFCTFSVDIQDSTGTGIHSGGGGIDTVGGGDPDAGTDSWQFTSGGITYKGNGLSTEDLDTLGKSFLIVQSDGFNVDSLFTLVLPISSSNVKLGTYKTNDVNNLTGLELDELNSGDQLFIVDYLHTNATLTITLTGYDAATKLLTGTFSGTADDKNGSVVTITNGSFSVTIQ